MSSGNVSGTLDWPAGNLLALGDVLHREMARAGYIDFEPAWTELSSDDKISYCVIAKVIARKYEAIYGLPMAGDL